MQKITKKSFIDIMTENNHIFFGYTSQKQDLFTDDELELSIDNFKSESGIVEERSTVKHSTFLEFSGGSRLYFDQKNTEYTFYELEYSGYILLACMEKYSDKDYQSIKVMYYLIKTEYQFIGLDNFIKLQGMN